jgi:hypothetical protein
MPRLESVVDVIMGISFAVVCIAFSVALSTGVGVLMYEIVTHLGK